MLQNFKTIFPWILVVILGLLLWRQGRNSRVLKDNYESIIDSLKISIVEKESIVDSFSVVRTSIRESRDSSISCIDTMGIYNISNLLKSNIIDYEKGFY